MRYLVCPLIGISNVAGDSDYIAYADYIEKSYAMGGKHYFTMVLPKRAENFKPLPNCDYVFTDQSNDYFEESMHADKEVIELFNRRSGTRLFDVLMTSKAGGSLIFQSQLSDYRRSIGVPTVINEQNLTPYNAENEIPTVIVEPMVRAWQRPNDVDGAMRALSYCTAYCWMFSDEEKQRALSLIRRFCPPSLAKQFTERVHIDALGIRVPALDAIIAKYPEKYEKFGLFFGARFSREKRPDIVVDLLEHFFSFGRDVDIHVTTQHIGSRYLLKYGNKASSIKELVKGCSREDFLERAVKSHVFICASDDESWPAGFWEQLYLVQVGIFPDQEWARAVLPKNYPYIFSSKNEAHAMLRWIYENYDEALAKVSWIREWIRENANMEKTVTNFLKWTETVPLNKQRIAPSLGKLFMDTAEKLGNDFSFTPFLEQIEKDAISFKPISVIARTKYPNKYEVYRYMLENGFEDTYDSIDPHLKKT